MTRIILLPPYHVTARSNKRVRWICRGRHKWLASVKDRSNGAPCPYDTGKLRCIDFETVDTSLHAQQNSDHNAPLTNRKEV